MYPTQNFEIFYLRWVPGPNSFKNMSIFQKTFNLGDFLGVKNGERREMFDEMGQNSSKFGNFDTDRCALISGPQKCWFWPIFPNFLRVKIDFSFFGPFRAPRVLLLAPINPDITWN